MGWHARILGYGGLYLFPNSFILPLLGTFAPLDSSLPQFLKYILDYWIKYSEFCPRANTIITILL